MGVHPFMPCIVAGIQYDVSVAHETEIIVTVTGTVDALEFLIDNPADDSCALSALLGEAPRRGAQGLAAQV